MRTIELNALSFIASPDEKKFILLRSEKAEDETFLNEFAVPKILNRTEANKIPGVWGTLGYKDDKAIDWTGTLEASNDGNDEFKEDSTVKDEVEILKLMYPNLKEKGQIKEKVINLNQLEIPIPEIFSLEEIPQLRLDIFLGQDEGALTFYQFNKENNKDAELEFIQPQATQGNNTDSRDRLTYFFNIISRKNIEEVPDIPNRYRLSSEISEDDFIIKVLIFKRVFETKKKKTRIPTSSQEIVELVEQNLAAYPDGLFVKDHVLLIFNPKNNKFTKAQPGSIDTSKKTLLLFHGTFASTKGSFGEVYDWIGSMVGKNKYEQVIAFDHPTLFWDAKMNIEQLFAELNDVGVQAFEHEVDLIGTSQGGLLAQFLANYEQSSIKVGKVALVASANGVDYLSFVQGLTSGLKLFRKVMGKLGSAPVVLISALLQHSFEWVVNRPGLAVMNPGSGTLISIIYQKPLLQSTRYLPLAGNYESKGWFNKRRKKRLELAIDAILDDENDWVVGTKKQFKAPGEYVAIAGYNPGKYREFMINDAKHGSLIEKDDAQNRIEQFFFHQSMDMIDTSHKNSVDLFDGHCHLFGRSIITGRLILMIFGDLIDYFKNDNPDELQDLIDIREESDKGHGFSAVVKNIFKYFLFNKGAHQMLHDLEDDYYDIKAKTYRFIPLMFDLEMTFRNDYDKNDAGIAISERMQEFGTEHDKFFDRISTSINKFEKEGKSVFKGTLIQNEESVRILKYIKTILKSLNLANEDVEGDAKSSYHTQITELSQLKTIYGTDVFPFLATDPRREGMGNDIVELVGPGKIFHGIKLYTPNGYSPTDPYLYDPTVSFVDGTCLYQWCIDNNIAIMAHNSDAGFATFTDRLQVFGHICTNEPDESDNKFTYKLKFKDKEYIDFRYNLFKGGFGNAVKERAHILNHPSLWRKVLEQFPDLKICFAHFGGGSDDWQAEIKQLILDYENVYTDLSCQTNLDKLDKIRQRYYNEDTTENIKLRNRIMYGSDYFLNMLQGIKFENYYKNFRAAFNNDQLKFMSFEVPRSFLGV